MAPGRLPSPANRRRAVAHVRAELRVSERRACRVVGQARNTPAEYIGVSSFLSFVEPDPTVERDDERIAATLAAIDHVATSGTADALEASA